MTTIPTRLLRFFGRLVGIFHAGEGETPEEQICPRRTGMESNTFPPPDHWITRTGMPYRSCSFCGSIHPDDALHLLNDGQATVETTTKHYKFYLQPTEGSHDLGCCKLYIAHFRDKGHWDEFIAASKGKINTWLKR